MWGRVGIFSNFWSWLQIKTHVWLMFGAGVQKGDDFHDVVKMQGCWSS